MSHNSYENNRLYLLKAICAYLVVLLHCAPPGNIGIVVEVVARIAVPLFFMISGYYSYPFDYQVIKHRISSVIRLIISVEVIYSLTYIRTQEVHFFYERYLRIREIVRLFVFSRYGLCGVGWYLYALLFCYIFFIIISKKNILEKCHSIQFIGGILGVHIILQVILKNKGVTSDYYTSNFLFMGLPFFWGGVLCCKYREMIQRTFNEVVLLLMSGLGIILSLLQRRYIYGSDLYVGTVLSVGTIFIYCIKGEDTKYYFGVIIGKFYSKYIYILHLLIKEIVLFEEINIKKFHHVSLFYLYLRPLMICVLTTVAAIIYRYAFDKCDNKLCDNNKQFINTR